MDTSTTQACGWRDSRPITARWTSRRRWSTLSAISRWPSSSRMSMTSQIRVSRTTLRAGVILQLARAGLTSYPMASRERLQARMAEIDLPEGNSYRSKAKPPEARVEMVARGRISESPMRRIRESIFETSGKQLVEFVIFDVLIPQLKEGASTIFDRVLYGEGRGHRVTPYRKAQSYVNYSRTSTDGSARDPKRNLDTRKRVNHDFRDIAFDDRSEAELILERLGDCIEEYDVATVGDFYAAAGITADYTDQNWGWTSLRDACVRRTRAGYILDLPRPERVDP
nr:MAG TPA: hypothetical protein [Caudoviricetes sp.]DAX63485.1 MAG TPA: hypothetical protein [Caudoviricetes sp.]